MARHETPSIRDMKIILVRHGMPAWDFRTPISGREFAAWRQGEDAAPIDPSHRPSAALEGLVRDASFVAASTLRRALVSAPPPPPGAAAPDPPAVSGGGAA